MLIHVGKRLNISACREFPRLLGELQFGFKGASLFAAEMFEKEMHYPRLRGTHCTWLAEANVPVHVIDALAGHSAVPFTEGYITTNNWQDGNAQITVYPVSCYRWHPQITWDEVSLRFSVAYLTSSPCSHPIPESMSDQMG